VGIQGARRPEEVNFTEGSVRGGGKKELCGSTMFAGEKEGGGGKGRDGRRRGSTAEPASCRGGEGPFRRHKFYCSAVGGVILRCQQEVVRHSRSGGRGGNSFSEKPKGVKGTLSTTICLGANGKLGGYLSGQIVVNI